METSKILTQNKKLYFINLFKQMHKAICIIFNCVKSRIYIRSRLRSMTKFSSKNLSHIYRKVSLTTIFNDQTYLLT